MFFSKKIATTAQRKNKKVTLKISSAFNLLSVLGLLGALLIGVNANATGINQSGVQCHNYNAGESKFFAYTSAGIVNIDTTPRWVICPVIRESFGEHGSDNYTELFEVHVFHQSPLTTKCSLLPTSITGLYLGAVSILLSTTFPNETQHAEKQVVANVRSSLSLICELAPNRQAELRGFSSTQ